MKTFRILCVLVLSLIFVDINAQAIIVKGGVSLSNALIKDDYSIYSKDFKIKTGFSIGLSTELNVSKNLLFEPGISFISKGFKFGKTNGSITLYYIDAPIDFKYRIPIKQSFLLPTAGIYLGFGIKGISKTITSSDEVLKGKVQFGEDKNFKTFDYGLCFGFGMEYLRFVFGAYYKFSLANISTDNSSNHTVKNQFGVIVLGYKIGE